MNPEQLVERIAGLEAELQCAQDCREMLEQHRRTLDTEIDRVRAIFERMEVINKEGLDLREEVEKERRAICKLAEVFKEEAQKLRKQIRRRPRVLLIHVPSLARPDFCTILQAFAAFTIRSMSPATVKA